MAKLRSGNGTDYPNAIDTDLFADDDQLEVDNATIPRAAIPNDLALANIAVQTELGTDPAGSLTDVVTWLQTEHTSAGVHAGSATMSSFTLTTPTFDTTYTPTAAVWPSFKAFISGAHPAVATGGPGFTKIEFDDDSTAPAFDTGGDYDAATDFDFTIPTGGAGKYYFHATVEFPGASVNARFLISLFKDGTEHKRWTKDTGPSTATNIIVPFTAYVENAAAGEVYDIRVQHNSSGALTPTNSSAVSWFIGFRVA